MTEKKGFSIKNLESNIAESHANMLAESDTIKRLREVISDCTAENLELKSQIAALQKRLDNAVELPCKVGDTVWCIRDLGLGNYRIIEKTVSEIAFDYNNQMHIKTPYGSFDFEKWTYGLDCFTDCATAEAHLKELEGDNE